MAATLPAQARPFLAGGSRAVTAFVSRPDLWLLARGLRFDDDLKKDNLKLINDFPKKQVEDEKALLTEYEISHICAKMQVENGLLPRLRPPASLAYQSVSGTTRLSKGHQHYQFAIRFMM